MLSRTPFALAAFIGFVALPGLAQAPADDPDGLEKRLRQIRALMTRDRWDTALDRLERTIRDHENQPSARKRAAELIELHKRCSFRASVGNVDPDSVVSGALRQWKPESGKVEIRYTPDTMQDFEKSREGWVHPMQMAGPHTVKIEGKHYPSILHSRASPTICVCSGAKTGLLFAFGFEQKSNGSVDRWLPARCLDLSKAGNAQVVDEKEITLAKSAKPYRLEVDVSKRGARAKYNGRTLLRTRKSDDLYGYIAIYNVTSFTELTIEGIAEPAWIQGRIDSSLEKARVAFEKRYDPKKVLPSWLFESGEPAERSAKKTSAAPEAAYPGPAPTERQQYYVRRAERMIERERYAKAISFVERQSETRIPEPIRSLLLATCHVALDDYEAALPHAKRVSEAAPGYRPARVLEAECLAGTGKRAAAIASFEKLVAEDSRDTSSHVELATLYMLESRFADAKRVTTTAMSFATAEDKKALDPLFRSVVKAVDGPDWKRVYESKSRHYHVFSDIDRKTCVEAARLLEEAYRCYNVHLGAAKRTTERFRVYLFAGEAGYAAYCEDLFGEAPRHTAGLYSDYIKQLLIWNLPNRDAMMRTVRHEGFHQYLARVLPDAPRWFDEGHAEYYETAEYANGRWRTGRVREDHLETLREKKNRPRPLREFLYIKPSKFYDDAARNYAQAWAFIHFLRHGPSEYGRTIDDLFTRLQKGEAVRETVRAVFPDEALPELERAFHAYLAELVGG